MAQTADVTSAQAKAQTSPAQVAESVADARRLVEVGQSQVQELDQAIIMELKEAIRDGKFGVEPHALSGRLLDDVFGGIAEA